MRDLLWLRDKDGDGEDYGYREGLTAGDGSGGYGSPYAGYADGSGSPHCFVFASGGGASMHIDFSFDQGVERPLLLTSMT